MKVELVGFDRIQAADAAARAGRRDEATSILRDVASESNAGARSRREAQRLLDRAQSR
jgi:hypothetical protein